MIDDKDSACFERDVWWAKACLCKNIMMIHGYKKIHAQKTCFPAASNAMLSQKLTSAPRCLGSYTALDVESESCRKQQHTNNNAQNTLGGVLQS